MAPEELPVIDVARLSDATMLRSIHEACCDWGFFQVTRHGIESDLIAGLHREMSAFFALPIEAKRRVSRTAEVAWGFYDRELTKNTRDWKQVFDYGLESEDEMRCRWPSERPALRRVLGAFAAACERLAFELLAAIASNLGATKEALSRHFRPNHTSFLRLNYYPACPASEVSEGLTWAQNRPFGVNHHTDSGALTLLVQDDQPGLEVLHGGRWHRVEPRPDVLVVNVGDIVQVWSNDRYPAALHRVTTDPSQPRFSAPFFFNPAYSARYAPLPSAILPGDRAHYGAIHWGEFRAKRAAGDYRDCGEEVQISHYRSPTNRS